MVCDHWLPSSSCQYLTLQCRTWTYQLPYIRFGGDDDMARVSFTLRALKFALNIYRLGSVINDFRTTRLGLEPLNVRSGPGIIDRLKVPWTYCFSPEIVPKPDDWQNHIGSVVTTLL